MIGADISVRARHKLETISLIHDIAQQLALTQGLANAKVEEIATAAGISRRTFFNYFPTKEDAVLGLQAPTLPAGAKERFNERDDDVLTRTAHLIMDVTRTSIVPSSTAKRRKELRRRFPELIQRFELRAEAAEKIVRPILVEYLNRHVDEGTAEEVTVILGLAGVVIRYAYAIDPEVTNDSIAQSIELFTTTIRKRL